MPTRKAQALWEGSLPKGKGTMTIGSGVLQFPFTFASRFESGAGTNPEELIGAAHAGCFSMALSAGLGAAGFTPTSVATTAQVTLDSVDGNPRITHIHLECEAHVPGISNEQFQQIAKATKEGCPVSVALSNVAISLAASLVA